MALVHEANWSKLEDKSESNRLDLLCPKHNSNSPGSKGWLVHVIDGFVIEESSVPFENEGTEENNDPNSMEIPKQNQIVYNADAEDNDINTLENWGSLDSQSYEQPHVPVFPTNCKLCGGPLPEERAFWGKRFCSKSCGKRYTASYAYRARRGLHKRGSSRGRGRGYGKLRRTRDEEIQPSFDTRPTTHENTPTEDTNPAFRFDEPYPWPYEIDGIEQHDFEEDLFDGVEPLLKYASVPAVLWSTDDVVSFISEIPGCQQYAEKFSEEEIDGPALMLIKEEHLVQTMGLKLGPALKISAHLRSFKNKYGVRYFTKYLSSPL